MTAMLAPLTQSEVIARTAPVVLAPESSDDSARRRVLAQAEQTRARTRLVLDAMTFPYPKVNNSAPHEHPWDAACLTCAVGFSSPNRTVGSLVLNTLSLHRVDETWNLKRTSAQVIRKVHEFRVTPADLERQFGPQWGRILDWALTLSRASQAQVHATAELGATLPRPQYPRPEVEWLLGAVLTDVYGPPIGRATLPHEVRSRVLPFLARYIAQETESPTQVRRRPTGRRTCRRQ